MLQSHDITISFINHAYLIYHSTYVQFVFGLNQEKMIAKNIYPSFYKNGKLYMIFYVYLPIFYIFRRSIL